MDILKGINKETIESTNDLGNNFIRIKNILDVGHVDSSVRKFLNEGLYKACEKANIEFKKKKKLDFGINISYWIKMLPKENIFTLYCEGIGSSNTSDRVFITMEGITYENLITAYGVITNRYIAKFLNDKINNVISDNENIIDFQ